MSASTQSKGRDCARDNRVHIHMRRLVESTSFFRKPLIILLNSIRRWSFRRSSFGLHRRLYTLPSVPRMLILRGFCNELRTKASSKTSVGVSVSVNSQGVVTFIAGLTLHTDDIPGERIEYFYERSFMRRWKDRGQHALKRHNQATGSDFVVKSQIP